MATLAVGVVGHEVEGADPRQPLAMRGVLAEREVVLREVRMHELLKRALAVRSVAAHRQWHEAPAERFGQLIGGELALEEARRKIPERTLAALRLVHGERARPIQRD